LVLQKFSDMSKDFRVAHFFQLAGVFTFVLIFFFGFIGHARGWILRPCEYEKCRFYLRQSAFRTMSGGSKLGLTRLDVELIQLLAFGNHLTS
jgi:hypothetical protein